MVTCAGTGSSSVFGGKTIWAHFDTAPANECNGPGAQTNALQDKGPGTTGRAMLCAPGAVSGAQTILDSQSVLASVISREDYLPQTPVVADGHRRRSAGGDPIAT